MIAVTLGIRWIELFGENKSKMPDKIRRSRWEKWKQLCRDNGGFEIVEYWSTPDPVCLNCKHCDGDWCRFQSLPCSVNPITTFSSNEIGMACMGIGFHNKQQELFKDK